jgi:hypothetical protein
MDIELNKAKEMRRKFGFLYERVKSKPGITIIGYQNMISLELVESY